MVNLTNLELIFRDPLILGKVNDCAKLYQKRLDGVEQNERYKKAVRDLRTLLNTVR